jgi:pimeloyl-ACP methyl ester carboxylesterase
VTPELPPLVLLHGLTRSGGDWRETVPLLVADHTVYTPSALGHRGGPAVQRRPATIWDVIDASERYLDEKGLHRPHLAGHSMGGFVALELARRGRAASVCAIAPAGLWSDEFRVRAIKLVRRNVALARLMHPLTPFLMKSPRLRRYAFRDAMLRGDRLSADRAVEIVDESVGCTIVKDIFNGADEHVAQMDPLPCPITIAWAEKDIVIPIDHCDSIAREHLPHATVTVLSDVAHDAISDDPDLVARTILATSGAATA